MSLEYFGKYHMSKRVGLFPTVNDAIVIIMGLTIADLSVGVVTFLVLAMFFGSPLSGLLLGIIGVFLRKQYCKHFPAGTLIQCLWRLGFYRKDSVPKLLSSSPQTTYGP